MNEKYLQKTLCISSLKNISQSLNILRFYSVVEDDASYEEFLKYHFHFGSFIHSKLQGFG